MVLQGWHNSYFPLSSRASGIPVQAFGCEAHRGGKGSELSSFSTLHSLILAW